MKFQAKWIAAAEMDNDIVPEYRREFSVKKAIKKAVLTCTALGTYEVFINGERVSDYVLAPGWTVYAKRHQVQSYDVTGMLRNENKMIVHVGKGWYASRLGWADVYRKTAREDSPRAFLGELEIEYADGKKEVIKTDKKWLVCESAIRFSTIYDGEVYDASFVPKNWREVKELKMGYDNLIPQEGEKIIEAERIAAKKIIVTPKKEILVDFGQEVTGYVEFTVDAPRGARIHILHSEMNDKDGNFYNANYRTANPELTYICKEGLQTYHPRLTFYGFRYIKLDEWPASLREIDPSQFTAIAVHSEMKKTGSLNSSDPMLNRLFSNIFWSQKGNFLDVPTDCPQRDERLGWTGDAAVFAKTATYNYDTLKFYKKWLHDVAADQYENGGIPYVSPDILKVTDFDAGGAVEMVHISPCSAAWGDCCCIIPWQVYQTYKDEEVLKEAYKMMTRWLDYIKETTNDEYLWTGGTHFGDWLALDAKEGSYKGSSRDDFIASAYYANSINIVIKTGRILKKSVKKYEELYAKVVKKFRKTFKTYNTQTEHVLAVNFGLAENPQKTVDSLVKMISDAGRMETGFLGTPFLLHVLTDYGYSELAYSLLLRKSYPSWLYSVTKGATTIWEHWDGIKEDGSFWSDEMNSYNHYSYGAVADWVYEKALGIRMTEAGFERLHIEPVTNRGLEFLEGSIDTRCGRVSVRWQYIEDDVRFDLELPVEAEVVIGKKTKVLKPGKYTLWG